MSPPLLDNLVRIHQLKAEPRSDAEVRRMLAMARTRLADAQLASLSLEGRFTSSYNAAHAAALAILRWHGWPDRRCPGARGCAKRPALMSPSSPAGGRNLLARRAMPQGLHGLAVEPPPQPSSRL